MSTRYTALAVKNLPYPHGLGKGDYKALERDMKKLLGERYGDPAANEHVFWTPDYQRLLNEHIGSAFESVCDITRAASRALEHAQAGAAFDVPMAEEGGAAYDRYTADLPAAPHQYRGGIEGEADRWMRNPPSLACDTAGRLTILDGRHRLSYLRSRVEPNDPDFPVLISILY